jgi:hypothetical protein
MSVGPRFAGSVSHLHATPGSRYPGGFHDEWTMPGTPGRVAEIGDLWAGIQADRQVLPQL